MRPTGSRTGPRRPHHAGAAAPILIDFPEPDSIFPPDITPPTFLWRDPGGTATVWRIEIHFGQRGTRVHDKSPGEKPQIGEVDTTLIGYVPPTLTPEQEAQHTWKPDAALWEKIKKQSQKQPATLVVTGYRDEHMKQPISSGQTNFVTSADPVGAPIFYRDVPLIPPDPSERERGIIHPLSDSVLPKIKWRIRYLNQTSSKTVMENLPTCANCHSISRDGKTLGIDVDGPQNDKALYGLIPIKKVSAISNDYVIHWSAYTETGSPKRFGFMSQVSPDGKFVVTSIEVPGTRGQRVTDRIYQGLYDYFGFGQVFYPTRGILAWYSKETKSCSRYPAPTIPNTCRPAPSGLPTKASSSSPKPRRAIRIRLASPPRNTPTIPTKPRSSTTCIASRSTTAKAVGPRELWARRKTG